MRLVWEWPQITWAILTLLGLVLHAAKNGEPMDQKWNFPLKLMCVVIAAILGYYGGFFTDVRP